MCPIRTYGYKRRPHAAAKTISCSFPKLGVPNPVAFKSECNQYTCTAAREIWTYGIPPCNSCESVCVAPRVGSALSSTLGIMRRNYFVGN